MALALRSASQVQQRSQQHGEEIPRRSRQQPDRYGQFSSLSDSKWEAEIECSKFRHDLDTNSAECDGEGEELQDRSLGLNSSQPVSAAAANHVGSELPPANNRRWNSAFRSIGKSPALIMLPDGSKAVRMAYHLTKHNHQLFVPSTLAHALPSLPHTLAVKVAIEDQPAGGHCEELALVSANRLYHGKTGPYYYLDQFLRDYIGYTVSKLTINSSQSQLIVQLQSRAGRKRTQVETSARLAAAAAAADPGSDTSSEHQEWRSGQQYDPEVTAHAAGKHASGSGGSHTPLLEDDPPLNAPAAAPRNGDASRVASTQQIDTAAARDGDTNAGNTACAPPATGVPPPAGHISDMVHVAATQNLVQTAGDNAAIDNGPGSADLAGVVTTGAKRQRVERTPAESVVCSSSILAQVDHSLLQSSNFLKVMAKLIEKERVEKEIELRRISLKEKQLDMCKMIMSDNAGELMTPMAAHKQRALPPPATAVAADADGAHGSQN